MINGGGRISHEIVKSTDISPRLDGEMGWKGEKRRGRTVVARYLGWGDNSRVACCSRCVGVATFATALVAAQMRERTEGEAGQYTDRCAAAKEQGDTGDRIVHP